MNAKKYVEAASTGVTPFLNTAGAPVFKLEKTDLRKRHQSESNDAFARLPWLSAAASKPIDREARRG